MKLERQIAKLAPQEQSSVLFPTSGETFISLGRGKFVNKLLQLYYIASRHPELWAKVIIDNPDTVAQLEDRVGKISSTREYRKLTKDQQLVVKVVWALSLIGPRTLGGRDFNSSLKDLRLSYKHPKRPKNVQRKRGYTDKGSLPSDKSRSAKISQADYYDWLEDIVNKISVRTIKVLDFEPKFEEGTRSVKICFTAMRRNGYTYDDDEVNHDLDLLWKARRSIVDMIRLVIPEDLDIEEYQARVRSIGSDLRVILKNQDKLNI
jgi:hypothetical protein